MLVTTDAMRCLDDCACDAFRRMFSGAGRWTMIYDGPVAGAERAAAGSLAPVFFSQCSGSLLDQLRFDHVSSNQPCSRLMAFPAIASQARNDPRAANERRPFQPPRRPAQHLRWRPPPRSNWAPVCRPPPLVLPGHPRARLYGQ